MVQEARLDSRKRLTAVTDGWFVSTSGCALVTSGASRTPHLEATRRPSQVGSPRACSGPGSRAVSTTVRQPGNFPSCRASASCSSRARSAIQGLGFFPPADTEPPRGSRPGPCLVFRRARASWPRRASSTRAQRSPAPRCGRRREKTCLPRRRLAPGWEMGAKDCRLPCLATFLLTIQRLSSIHELLTVW